MIICPSSYSYRQVTNEPYLIKRPKAKKSYLYYEDIRSNWIFSQEISADDNNDEFGHSIALSSKSLLTGAPTNESEENSGSAFLSFIVQQTGTSQPTTAKPTRRPTTKPTGQPTVTPGKILIVIYSCSCNCK